jgi:hypothetical protein
MEKVKDFNKAFRSMRMLTAISLIGFMCATLIYIFSYHYLKEAEEKQDVYVVTPQGTMQASLAQEEDINPFEARLLSELFIKQMFAHDQDTYTDHIEAALQLIDQPGGLMIAKAFEKGDVRNQYIRWGSRTSISIDSIRILNQSIPYNMVAYFRQQHYIGQEQKTELAIALKYDLIRTHRNRQNPLGLMMTRVDFIPYPITRQQTNN